MRRTRRGTAQIALVRRVMAMRVAVGDEWALSVTALARVFNMPIWMILGRRELRLARHR